MRPELKSKLHGTIVPTVTPMNEDYSLNLDLIPPLIDHLLVGGVKVVVPCGSTGEFPSLSIAERKQVVEATVAAVDGRIAVIAGVADTKLATVVDLANHASDAGANGVLITAPYYFLPSEDDVFRFLSAVDREIDIPFMFYNNPHTTKFNASYELIERMESLRNFGAVKENNSQPVRYYEELRRFGDRFPIIPAGEPPAIFNILSGAPGFMSVAANVNPALITRMLEAAKSADIEAAFEAFEQLRKYRELFEAANRQGFPMYVVFAKAALNLIGLKVGPPRPPLFQPSGRDLELLRNVLEDIMGLPVPA